MALNALRLAAAPLALAFLLPDLPAAPAPEGAPSKIRPTLRFQENYKERIVRYREDGETWREEAPTETGSIKVVVPIDPQVVDIHSFDEDTDFFFEVGESYWDGTLGDDPNYRKGDRSARIVVWEEEWYDAHDNDHYRPIVIVTLKWDERKWTMKVVQRPFKDWMNWDEDAFYMYAPEFAWDDDVALDTMTELPEEPVVTPISVEDPEDTCWFSLGPSVQLFTTRFVGQRKTRFVGIGSGDALEVFVLSQVRLRGAGDLLPVPEDLVAPTLVLDTVEEETAAGGALTGVYVAGECEDLGSGIYAVTARVDGGPPVALWWGAELEPTTYGTFDGVLPVTAPSGTITITVYDRAKNAKTVTIPYGSP